MQYNSLVFSWHTVGTDQKFHIVQQDSNPLLASFSNLVAVLVLSNH